MTIIATEENTYLPHDVGFEWMGYSGEATKEPVVCVEFDCGACGEKHAEFGELVKCFKAQQELRELIAVVVA
jgi:hypothetical protein